MQSHPPPYRFQSLDSRFTKLYHRTHLVPGSLCGPVTLVLAAAAPQELLRKLALTLLGLCQREMEVAAGTIGSITEAARKKNEKRTRDSEGRQFWSSDIL